MEHFELDELRVKRRMRPERPLATIRRGGDPPGRRRTAAAAVAPQCGQCRPGVGGAIGPNGVFEACHEARDHLRGHPRVGIVAEAVGATRGRKAMIRTRWCQHDVVGSPRRPPETRKRKEEGERRHETRERRGGSGRNPKRGEMREERERRETRGTRDETSGGRDTMERRCGKVVNHLRVQLGPGEDICARRAGQIRSHSRAARPCSI